MFCQAAAPEHEAEDVTGDREAEGSPSDGRECLEERLRGVQERPDVVHALTIAPPAPGDDLLLGGQGGKDEPERERRGQGDRRPEERKQPGEGTQHRSATASADGDRHRRHCPGARRDAREEWAEAVLRYGVNLPADLLQVNAAVVSRTR